MELPWTKTLPSSQWCQSVPPPPPQTTLTRSQHFSAVHCSDQNEFYLPCRLVVPTCASLLGKVGVGGRVWCCMNSPSHSQLSWWPCLAHSQSLCSWSGPRMLPPGPWQSRTTHTTGELVAELRLDHPTLGFPEESEGINSSRLAMGYVWIRCQRIQV